MQAKRTTLTLLMTAIVLVACTGIPGSAICYGQQTDIEMPVASISDGYQACAPDGKAYLYGLPAEYAIGLLYARAAGPSFGAPGISRARNQVYQNENRNQIIKFIADNPGSRLYDVISALNMNIGTTRYHLMILSLNHILVPYQDGTSHIRYFTNSGIYSGDQMKIISVLRREPTSRLLGALAGQSGMTNASISLASGLPYSDVNRYLKELISKGIVVQEPAGKDKHQYRIAPGHEEFVVKNIQRYG